LLVGAELQGASLNGAQLQGASLLHTQLQGALLDSAGLQGASLFGAELQGASLVGAQLQGASLEGSGLQAADLSGALFWRSRGDGAHVAAVSLTDAFDPWRPSWNNKAYQDLGQMMESVPSGSLRDHGLNRIRILDCANPDSTLASCDPAVPPPAEAAAWRNALEGARVDDAAYFAALATALKTLVCSGGDDAAYVLRGLQSNGQLAAAGPEAPALIDFIMSKDCPVSASLTDADKANLLRIKQHVIKEAGQ
jgi:uncharacterized protein YjbI with pentapeptide repeats